MLNRLSKYRSELMGICIIWIMLFHSQIEAPDNIVLRSLWYVLVSFGGGFGVNIFLMLSGFGLMYSELKSSNIENWIAWYKKRLVRILPTYLFVAIVFYAITCNNMLDVIYNVSFLNFLIDGKRDFWYIFAILFCYFCFPPIAIFYKKYNPFTCVLFFSALILIVGFFLNVIIPFYYFKIEILLQRIPCFLFGAYIGCLSYNNQAKEYNMFMLFSVLAGMVLLFSAIQFPGSGRWLFVLFSVPIMTCLAIPVALCNFSILRWLGNRSLEIYLVHVSFGLLIKSAFNSFIMGVIAYFISSLIIADIIYRIICYLKKCL